MWYYTNIKSEITFGRNQTSNISVYTMSNEEDIIQNSDVLTFKIESGNG